MKRGWVALLVALTLFALITPSATAQGAMNNAEHYAAISQQASDSAVDGMTYVSPTYGHGLSWNES